MNDEQYGLEDVILGEYGSHIYDAAAALSRALTVLEWIREDNPDALAALSVPLDAMKLAREHLRQAYCNFEVADVYDLGVQDRTYQKYRREWNQLVRRATAESFDAYEAARQSGVTVFHAPATVVSAAAGSGQEGAGAE